MLLGVVVTNAVAGDDAVGLIMVAIVVLGVSITVGARLAAAVARPLGTTRPRVSLLAVAIGVIGLLPIVAFWVIVLDSSPPVVKVAVFLVGFLILEYIVEAVDDRRRRRGAMAERALPIVSCLVDLSVDACLSDVAGSCPSAIRL